MTQEMCNIHPDKEVVDVCVHCGKKVCVLCAAVLAGKTYCNECIKHIDAPAAANLKPIAWENRSEEGFLAALFKTWKEILFQPKKFFSSMPTKAAIASPLLFAVIWGSLTVIISAFINMMFVISGATLPNLPPGSTAPPQSVMVGSHIVLMIVSPLLVIAGVFLISLIYHLIVLIFGGKEGFKATLRVLCYTNALSIFNIIPLAGPIFVTVYSMILFVIGFKRAQNMSTPKAVMVALLPMIFLFIVGFAAAFYLASQGTSPQPVVPGALPVLPVPTQ